MIPPEEIEKFLSYVEKSDGCWIWTGGKRPTKAGLAYGVFQRKVDGKRFGHAAHRFSYEAFVGPPGKLFVCHKCDNPPCVRPDHLFLGTGKDNMRDCAEKDRRTHTTLTNEIVASARKRAASGEYITELAAEYSVDPNNLYKAVRSGWEHLDVPPVEKPKVKRYRKASKLSHEDYLEIVEALKKPYWGQVNHLAKKYGVGHSLISHIKTGRWAPTTISIHE